MVASRATQVCNCELRLWRIQDGPLMAKIMDVRLSGNEKEQK